MKTKTYIVNPKDKDFGGYLVFTEEWLEDSTTMVEDALVPGSYFGVKTENLMELKKKEAKWLFDFDEVTSVPKSIRSTYINLLPFKYRFETDDYHERFHVRKSILLTAYFGGNPETYLG